MSFKAVKPMNLTTPAYPHHGNFALHEMVTAGSNPVHTAHEQKAFGLKSPKTQFHQPNSTTPGQGSPWLEMAKGKK